MYGEGVAMSDPASYPTVPYYTLVHGRQYRARYIKFVIKEYYGHSGGISLLEPNNVWAIGTMKWN